MMINEKLPPYFLQGGHPTLRELAVCSAQPVNWSGRLLSHRGASWHDQGPPPSHASLGYPLPSHPQNRYTTGLSLESRRGGSSGA